MYTRIDEEEIKRGFMVRFLRGLGSFRSIHTIICSLQVKNSFIRMKVCNSDFILYDKVGDGKYG